MVLSHFGKNEKAIILSTLQNSARKEYFLTCKPTKFLIESFENLELNLEKDLKAPSLTKVVT